MPAPNQLRLASTRAAAAYPAPALSQPATNTYARHLSSIRQLPPSLQQQQSSSPRHGSSSSSSSATARLAVARNHRLPPSSLPPAAAQQQQIAKMSTMPATHGHNEACCNIPPVVSTGYTPKGTYEEISDMKMKTYVTGPADATKGIVVIYDIFGYFDQTVQGADILATSHAEKYRVFIPDWFHGEPCPIEWYPPDTPQKQKDLGAFFAKFPPTSVADKLPELVKSLSAKYPSIKSWGILGYCWGGKVVSLVTSSDSNPFVIGAQCHPAMVEPQDAETVRVPLVLLASEEEPPETVKQFEAKLRGPKHVETFGDQVHGWMAARADLSNERVRAEYTRGYKVVLDFFAKHWPSSSSSS